MILTANKAYEISKSNIKEIKTQELEYVLNEIAQATEKGKFEITCSHLYNTTKKQLKNLGYKVKLDECFNDVFYTISWKKNKYLDNFYVKCKSMLNKE